MEFNNIYYQYRSGDNIQWVAIFLEGFVPYEKILHFSTKQVFLTRGFIKIRLFNSTLFRLFSHQFWFKVDIGINSDNSIDII